MRHYFYFPLLPVQLALEYLELVIYKGNITKLWPEWMWLEHKPVFHSAWRGNSDGIHDWMQGATASSSSNRCCCICSHHLQVWSDIAPTMTMSPPWTGWTWVCSTTIISHSSLHYMITQIQMYIQKMLSHWCEVIKTTMFEIQTEICMSLNQ